MSNNFDDSLNKMNQEIHRLLHQDGISDITGGYLLIYSGILSFFVNSPLSSEIKLSLEFLCLSLAIVLRSLLRRKFVYPRVGVIRPPPINRRMRKTILTIMLSIILFCVVGMIIAVIGPPFIDTLNAKLDSLDWELLGNDGSFFTWLLAGVFFIFELFYSLWLKIPRVFLTNLLFLIGMVFGSTGVFMGIPILYCQIIYLVTGCVLLLIGIYIFLKFLKKYPVLYEGGNNNADVGFRMGNVPKDGYSNGGETDE